MSVSSGPLTGWIRKLLGGARGDAPRRGGRPFAGTAREAVVAVESGLCESIWGLGGSAIVEHGRDANVFGRRSLAASSHDPLRCLAAAAGTALAGVRTAVFLDADALPRVLDPLAAAAARRSPLVVHVEAAGRGHGGVHSVSGCGALILFARNPQEAVDLAVAARVVAEASLSPVLIVRDPHEGTTDLLLPDDDLLRDFVGDPSDVIDSVTPSQQMIFGDRRRRLPRWFDPDHPAAIGVRARGAELDAAVAGRRAFFGDHAVPIAAEAMEALAALTGRDLPALSRSGPPRARKALIVQGSAATIAVDVGPSRATAVVTIVRARPFPAEELRSALEGAVSATVLERVDEAEHEDPPLFRDVAVALRGSGPALISATYERLEPAWIEALIANMDRGKEARPSLRLGILAPARRSEYPKRQALLDRISRAYPGLGSRMIDASGDREIGALREAETAPPPEMGAPAIPAASELPWAVRRFDLAAPTYDSVARFWGEFTEPRRDVGEHAVPDPYLALGAVPPCTATFHDRALERVQAPIVDPSRCTACGTCWTSCPDSSIAPVGLGVDALLDAAIRTVPGEVTTTAGGSKLRRGLRQIAARIEQDLAAANARSLGSETIREALDRILPRLGLTDSERVDAEEVGRGIAGFLGPVGFAATPALFHRPHAESKGTGALVLLAINPRTCQGCGVCAEVCPDEAISIVSPQNAETVAMLRDTWRVWEALPDTPAATIGRAADDPTIGGLPAILMSRHCLFSVTGADGAERGSGERLATRQIAAVVEYEMQRRVLRHAENLEELETRVRKAVADGITGSLPADDLDRIDEALAAIETSPRGEAPVADVARRLEAAGPTPKVPVERLKALSSLARRLERARWRATVGVQGIGRSRYGVVLAGRSMAAWAASFPRNPFSVPVAVDLAGEGADLAVGLVEGLLAELLDDVRDARLAALLVDPPPDLAARRSTIEAMTWRDLSAEELAACPPVLVLAGSDALEATGIDGWNRLLSSRLPVKWILLDDRDPRRGGTDPSLLALAHRRAFVLATSIAHPSHLFEGLRAALASPGPAFVHIHAPSPSRHGFSTERTVERARLAVAARVHPLIRYDPSRPGVFGARLDLGGNPEAEAEFAPGLDGAPFTPRAWMAGEGRFASAPDDVLGAADRDRAEHWRTLQELSGLVTPFVDDVRRRAEADLADERARELAALEADHARRLAALDAATATRLRDRLLDLAGFGIGARGAGDDPS